MKDGCNLWYNALIIAVVRIRTLIDTIVVRIRILIITTVMRIATVNLARRSDWLVSSHDYGETDKGAGHCIGKVNIGAFFFFFTLSAMQKSHQVALCYFRFEQLKNSILQNCAYAFDSGQFQDYQHLIRKLWCAKIKIETS